MARSKKSTEEEFEKSTKKSKAPKYVLNLYVAGLSPRSQAAIENIKKLCSQHLKGPYELKIQDIYQNPIIAKNGQILAVPALIKQLPLPLRKFVGDMSDTDKLLVGLDIRTEESGR
jgi:circadian clock protein KaiB